MISFDRLAADESQKRYINIRDVSLGYGTAFWLEEGKKLSITNPAGEKNTYTCKAAGSHHFYLGSSCFHIDEFAELVHKKNLLCEPEAYVTDVKLYSEFFADRNLKDLNGKLIPYRAILENDASVRENWRIAVCPDTVIGRQVCFWTSTPEKPSSKTFYSVSQAMSELLPKLNLPIHERKLLHAIFEDMERQIPRITQQEFDAIPKDYKGVYEDFDGKHPEWKGKRTAFLPGHGTQLFIEDVSFIIDAGKKPALSDRVSAAEKKNEAAKSGSGHGKVPEQGR